MFDPAEPPACGQVWDYASPLVMRRLPFMLVRRESEANGNWIVFWFSTKEVGDSPMCALYDDPEHRLPGYERLA